MTKKPDTIEELEAPAEETLSAKEVAAQLGIDAKSFRRWLRRYTDNRAGKGGRWSFSPAEADSVIEAYLADKAKVEEDEDIDEMLDEV